MSIKGGKSTPQEAAAGAANLARWRENNPEPALKHGGYSKHIQQRYSDHRYKEAKEINGVTKRLTADAGGPDNLSEGQRLLLGVIRSKFIIVKQISSFVTKQEGIVDCNGEILPCLKSFTTFTEAMRRTIEAFYAMSNRKPSRVPTIEQIISGKE